MHECQKRDIMGSAMEKGDTYVLLRLRVQNRRKKWNFLPNFRNGII